MITNADRTQEYKTSRVTHADNHKHGGNELTTQFVDNRQETNSNWELNELANNSSTIKHAIQLNATFNKSSRIAMQLKDREDAGSLKVGGKNLIPNQQNNLNKGIPSKNSVTQFGGRKGDKKTKKASKKDADAREGSREARYASTTGGGTTTFNNNEKKLPKAPKGQEYIETDVGKGRNNRGKRRVVSLVESNTGKVLKQYNTEDHYSTFK
jgi:guanyl-specific ribonuclease Sa